MEKNYSIIIPHKNIPDLLKRCLDSIPRRNDVQIIVVDDNSDPEKVDFSNFPGVGEKCVEVYFTKEGKGAGFARNVGLKYAIGKWVLFADADDFFSGYVLEKLDKNVSKGDDIIFYDAVSVDSITKGQINFMYYGVELHNYIQASEKNLRKAELNLRYNFGPPWCKMIKRDIIERYNIRFEEVPKHNDTLFSLYIGYYAASVYIDKQILYFNTYRNGSISNSVETFANMSNTLLTFYRYDKFIDDIICKRDRDFIPKSKFYPYLLYVIRRGKNFKKCFCFLLHENLLSVKVIIYFTKYLLFAIMRKIKTHVNLQ